MYDIQQSVQTLFYQNAEFQSSFPKSHGLHVSRDQVSKDFINTNHDLNGSVIIKFGYILAL